MSFYGLFLQWHCYHTQYLSKRLVRKLYCSSSSKFPNCWTNCPFYTKFFSETIYWGRSWRFSRWWRNPNYYLIQFCKLLIFEIHFLLGYNGINEFWEDQNEKLATLLLLSTVALAGCSSVQRSLRGDDYVDSSLAAEESSKVAAQSAKELNDALTNENANFPQLSKEVAEDEAEVILHTSQGDIRIKLFPKLAPLAVENFLTHAKEGYYNGITFHRVIDGFMVQTGDPKGRYRWSVHLAWQG